jgi:hypothetical protein
VAAPIAQQIFARYFTRGQAPVVPETPAVPPEPPARQARAPAHPAVD